MLDVDGGEGEVCVVGCHRACENFALSAILSVNLKLFQIRKFNEVRKSGRTIMRTERKVKRKTSQCPSQLALTLRISLTPLSSPFLQNISLLLYQCFMVLPPPLPERLPPPTSFLPPFPLIFSWHAS